MEHPPSDHDCFFALHLYRLLLFAYPPAFRDEYASEMLRLFRDAYRDVARQRGKSGVLLLVSEFLWDFLKTVCIEHARNWMECGRHEVALSGGGRLEQQFTLHVAQGTDIGRKRANNEDMLISVVPQDSQLLRAKGALFVVSDAMGDHMHGYIASELTVEKVKHYYYQNTHDDISTALENGIKQANCAIFQFNKTQQARDPQSYPIGATCVAAVLHEQALYIANIGDSRVYVLREGCLRQVTRDHSLVAQMVERGEITPAEARVHEKRHLLSRRLGDSTAEVDLFMEPVQEGDSIIICTDGLHGVVDDDEMRAIIEYYGPEASVPHLISYANEEGGPDNVTAIVVRVS